MTDFLDQTFTIDAPQNMETIKKLMSEYNITTETFLLGDQCKNRTETEKGGKICLTTTTDESKK
mgnify:FL=1